MDNYYKEVFRTSISTIQNKIIINQTKAKGKPDPIGLNLAVKIIALMFFICSSLFNQRYYYAIS
jgi:hypothetical protein